MGSIAGVYRASYKDKKSGELREASTWVATFWDFTKGKTVKAYGFQTAADAAEYRAQMMSVAGRKNRRASAIAITVGDLIALVIEDYQINRQRTTGKVIDRGARICELLGKDTPARMIDEARIRQFKKTLLSEQKQPATVNRYLAILKRGFRLAHREAPGLVVPYFGMMDERKNIRQGFFEKEDLEKILAHMPAESRPLIRALHMTGWRIGEMISRKWTDIRGGFLTLPPADSKNARGRSWPITKDFTDIIGTKPDGAIYIFGNGKEPIPYYTLRSQWERARTAAGLPDKLIHDLRRTAARDMRLAGVDQETIMRLMGHLTPAMFSRYQMFAPRDFEAAALKLAAYRNSA